MTSIEALEKMLETKDKRYYFELDNDSKVNYVLVKNMITIFQNDLIFLYKVIYNCVNMDEVDLADLLIRLIELIDNNYSKTSNVLKIRKDLKLALDSLIYNLYNVDFSGIYNTNDEDFQFEDVLFNESYSEKIDSYIAKNCVIDLFGSFDLEEYLHDNFKSYEKVKKYGVINIICDIVGEYDEKLAYYIRYHDDSINDIILYIEKIGSEWKKYEDEKQFNKYYNILEDLNEYEEEIDIDCDSWWNVLYKAAYDEGVLNDFIYYINSDDKSKYYKIKRKFEMKVIRNSNLIDFKKKKCLIKVKEIFRNNLKN